MKTEAWKLALALLLAAGPSSRAAFIGWASGGGDAQGGLLLCTTNGTDWFRQGAGQFGTAELTGVAAVNGRHVWIAGEPENGYASIYYSADAGESWVRQGDALSLPDIRLAKLWAVDRDVLWVIGDAGTVLVTADGGDNWINVSLTDYTNMLQGVTAVDEYTAWVSGDLDPDTGMAGLFYTEDGGATWTAQTNGAVTNAQHLLGLAALDADRVWAIGGPEVMLATTNAGAEWALLRAGFPKDGNELRVLDDQRIWAAFDSHVDWTSNGGATWSNHNTPDYTMDVSTPDGTSVWAVSGAYWGGQIYHSPDGGATWTNQAESNAWTRLFKVVVQPRPEPRTLHVDAASTNAVAPFDSWDTAASNIQDAVEAAVEGDLVLVADGVYDQGGGYSTAGKILNRVMINKTITVRSANGPAGAFIVGEGPDGPGAVRGAYLSEGACLYGFTVTDGHVFLASSGLGADLYGGGAYLDGPATVSNCVIAGNSGGGAFLVQSREVSALGVPTLCHSTVQSNQARAGGGLSLEGGGVVRHCRIVENSSPGNGGGVMMAGNWPGAPCRLLNCFIAGNRATDEDGVLGGGVNAFGFFSVRHCTIVGNDATGDAGGLYAYGDPGGGSEVVNTILYHNTAPTNPNLRAVYTDVRFGCSAPRPDGEGNIDDDPQLLALLNPHLAEASPCRGAGTTNGVEEGETDIDDEPRVVSGQTDVGCDQYTGGQIAGALTVDILAPYDALLTGVPLAMSADVIGKAYWQRWLIQTNSGARMVSNAVQVTQAWPVAGVYTVLLEAANATLTNADTLVVYVSESAEHYASPDGANEYPYTNWKTAANSLLDAVETCPAGGILYVGTGVYFEADTVRVTKPLSILGVGPAEEIQVDGQGAIPCFYLNHASAVLSNLTLVNGWSPDQGGGAYVRDGLVTHCHVISNYAFEQGGGLMAWGDARVEWCTIAGNEAGQWGGGIMANERAVIRNCFLQDNAAHNYGGGADISDGVRLQNCFITGNRAFGGGGVHLDGGGIAQNCTILKNEATDSGGGILHRFADTGATYNCIVYHNESPVGPNIAFQVSTTGTVEHTCSSPLFGGAGNITNEPALLGLDNPHIVASSPCIGAGSTNYIEGIEEDIDGEARVFGGAVDMGCDEFIGTNILGALTAAIRGETQVVAGEAAELFADIRGKAWGYVWNVAESGATNVIPDTFEIAPAWAAAGWYDVILAASNLETTAAATVSVHVIEGGFTNYVSPDGGHVAPFTNWTDAATNVQAAIDACWVGGVVMVGTGTYAEGRTIELNKPVAVVGAGAPEDCVFDGEMAYRVINLDDPRALLANIGVTGGWDEDAAGVAMLEGTVSNCVIAGNINAVVGGGIRCAGHSLLTDSLVTGNISQNWPGGVFCSGYGVVRNCLIEGNLAQVHGGGVYLDQGGVVTGCVIEANSAMSGGGAYLHYAGSVTHSTIHSNDSANGAGAFLYWGGVVTNCDITWNWGEMDGGGLWFNGGGLVTDSRVQRNFADEGAGSGGGAVLSQGGVLRRCDVSTNTASAGAGIYSQYGGLIDRCHIHHNVAPEGWGQASGGGVKLYQGDEIRNGLIEHNSSSNVAGGLLMLVGGTARNCTIANNTAGGEAGGMAVGSAGTLYNCIVYANTAPDAPNWDVDPGAVVDHCCTTPDFPAFVGTIAADPAFEGGGSYRLRTNSPCVNAGVNDYWMNGATDLDGSARIQNVAVDVGAYESAWWGLFTDVDEDDFNDWVEVNVTGTDPADETSFLGMRDFGVQGPGAEGIVVRWQSVAGKLYHVDRATNLVESPKFTNWMTGVVGLPGATEVTDTTATAGAPWFYRVGIEP